MRNLRTLALERLIVYVSCLYWFSLNVSSSIHSHASERPIVYEDLFFHPAINAQFCIIFKLFNFNFTRFYRHFLTLAWIFTIFVFFWAIFHLTCDVHWKSPLKPRGSSFSFSIFFFCELRQKIHLQPQEINKQKERIFKFTRKIMKDFFFFFADWITLTDLFALCFWTTLLDMREALSFHSYVKWLNVFLVFCCFLFGEFFFFSTFIDQLLLQCYSFFFFFLRVRGRRFISIIFLIVVKHWNSRVFEKSTKCWLLLADGEIFIRRYDSIIRWNFCVIFF